MLKVRNFEKFQHYKDRSPIWIKLYRSLLRDYEFGRLPDASRAHLLLIWLLASETGNELPHDAGWIGRQINASDPVDLDLLIRSGFLEDCASEFASKVDANSASESASTEREKEREKEKRESRGGSGETPSPAASREKRATASSPPKLCDEEFLEELQRNYDWLDVRLVYRKMLGWCKTAGKQPTRRRLVAWLNREDRPMARPARTTPKPEITASVSSPGAEEAEAFMDEWIAQLIDQGNLDRLKRERDGISSRGGPVADWERRVIAYFEERAATEAA